MLKIGEFSRLVRVPAKTLRYYDEIGLFKPAHYDADTGYRYYSVEQLPRLHRIVALKGLGLSLDQIKLLLTDDLSPEQIRGMLKMKRVEIIHKLDEEQMRLLLLESYLSQMENEAGLVQYDVILKSVEPIQAVTIRGVAPTLPQLGHVVWEYMTELHDYLQAHQVESTGPRFHIYHDDELPDEDIDIEVAYPVADTLPSSERVQCRTVEAVEQMACAVHHGPLIHMLRANVAIMQWISANGYHVDGPYREIYLQYQPQRDKQHYVTEVQFPVVRN